MLLLKALPGFATSSEVDGLTSFEDQLTDVVPGQTWPYSCADVTSFRYDFGNTGTTETYLTCFRNKYEILLINADQAPTLFHASFFLRACLSQHDM